MSCCCCAKLLPLTYNQNEFHQGDRRCSMRMRVEKCGIVHGSWEAINRVINKHKKVSQECSFGRTP
jgi:hypothetical protein